MLIFHTEQFTSLGLPLLKTFFDFLFKLTVTTVTIEHYVIFDHYFFSTVLFLNAIPRNRFRFFSYMFIQGQGELKKNKFFTFVDKWRCGGKSGKSLTFKFSDQFFN